MKLEERAKQEISELREFYTKDNLADFVKMCKSYELPVYECTLFLRGQTINDYKTTERNPNISEMAIRTYKWYHEIIKGK